MGWTFRRLSSEGTDFKRDYHVSFTQEELDGDGPLAGRLGIGDAALDVDIVGQPTGPAVALRRSSASRTALASAAFLNGLSRMFD